MREVREWGRKDMRERRKGGRLFIFDHVTERKARKQRKLDTRLRYAQVRKKRKTVEKWEEAEEEDEEGDNETQFCMLCDSQYSQTEGDSMLTFFSLYFNFFTSCPFIFSSHCCHFGTFFFANNFDFFFFCTAFNCQLCSLGPLCDNCLHAHFPNCAQRDQDKEYSSEDSEYEYMYKDVFDPAFEQDVMENESDSGERSENDRSNDTDFSSDSSDDWT